MRIALLLLSVFICWQMVAAGLIKDPPPHPKCDKDKHDGKKDKHPWDCCDDKKPEPKHKEEWKKKEGHSSKHHGEEKHGEEKHGKEKHGGEKHGKKKHGDEKHGADLSGLEHLVEHNPLVDKLSGKGLGGILDLTSGKGALINLGGVIGSKGGHSHLKGMTGKIPLIKNLPLKGILSGSDCDDDDDKKIHGIKRRGLTDDWISTGKDWKPKSARDILELNLGKIGKDLPDKKQKVGKSGDVKREKNSGNTDTWKVNNDKEGQRKGGWSREQKKKDVQISVALKDKKDSASWSDEWKSKDGNKGKVLKDSWNLKNLKKRIHGDED